MFYAYIYRDPTRIKNGSAEPFYVGKGKDTRAQSHLLRKDKHPLTHRLRKMSKEGVTPEIEIIPALDESHAFFLESCLIECFGRKDLGVGPLLNLTDGGEGCSGLRHTQATKDKISKLNLGKKLSDESRLKLSNSKKGIAPVGHSWSDESRQKLSVSQSGKERSKEHSAKLAAANCKPCTIDGINIFPSRKALAAVHGWSTRGIKSPSFRYVK